MAARKTHAEEQDAEKETDSQENQSESADSSENEKEEKTADSSKEKEVDVQTDLADSVECESKERRHESENGSEERDKNSLRTGSPETCDAMDVCDSGARGTENTRTESATACRFIGECDADVDRTDKDGMTESSKTFGTMDVCNSGAARTGSEGSTVNDMSVDEGDTENSQNRTASKNMDKSQEQLATSKMQSESSDIRTIHKNVDEKGDAPSDVIGEYPNNVAGKSPNNDATHVLCNGVMMDTMDVNGDIKHSSDSETELIEKQKTLKSESALDSDGLEVEKAQIKESIEQKSEISIQNKDSLNNASDCPNTNQSNNVVLPKCEVVRPITGQANLTGDEVGSIGDTKSGIASDLGENEQKPKIEGDEVQDVDADKKEQGLESLAEDGKRSSHERMEDIKEEVKEEGMRKEDGVKEEKVSSTKMESKTQDPKSSASEEDGGGAKGDTQPGDNVEMVERPPTPPPEPTPGLSPPEGEFELVCDCVEGFKALVEKFAQKEETVNVGRKSVSRTLFKVMG